VFEDYILTNAKVIDINDSEKKRRVKVQPLPELKDVIGTTDLPWAIPFSTFNSSSIMENDLPEVNSLIRLLVSNDWKRFYYLNNRFFYDVFNYTTIDTKLGTITDLSNKDYQNMIFRLYKDGGLDFHNNTNGDHGYLHKSGSYTLFDDAGNIITNANGKEMQINNAGKITFTSTGTLDIKGSAVTVEGTATATLKAPATNITGGTLTINGTATPPTGTGPFCGMPFCPLLTIPHSSSIVTGT
jgi:hypothetical protein